ncbi:hypothetical protein [Roseibium album]|uniref:hypothetical protein n=1 Tax=Roseibium album TaxID=311410 RepID=UPI00329782B0
MSRLTPLFVCAAITGCSQLPEIDTDTIDIAPSKVAVGPVGAEPVCGIRTLADRTQIALVTAGNEPLEGEARLSVDAVGKNSVSISRRLNLNLAAGETQSLGTLQLNLPENAEWVPILKIGTEEISCTSEKTSPSP